MKKNKKLLVVAIATALSAASAGSALALENQFTGAFTAYYDNSNFAGTGKVQKDAPTENFFVQRVRLGYTAKADDHAKLVTKFEFDYNYWGNSSYVVGRGSGGGLGADSVNMETKSLYLDLNYPAVNAKIGMMPNNDAFKGLLFDADMAGILLSHEYNKASVSAGFFRFGDTNDTTLGKNTSDMFSLEGKYSVSNNFKVGAGYYYINDKRSNADDVQLNPIYDKVSDAPVTGYTADGQPIYGPGTFIVTPQANNAIKIHTVGVNAEGVVGKLNLNGFALGQFGDFSNTKKAHGYAFNVGAKMPLSGGTARSEFLYVSGGSNAFYVASNGGGATEGGQFYDSEMTMLGRDKYETTLDNAIIYDVNNNNEGVIMGTLGYDYTFNDKVSASCNAGFAAIADDADGAKNRKIARGAGNYLGTEVNAEAYYKLSANVTLGARAGYLFLGDYFASGYDNPYDVKLIAKYNF